MTHIRTRIICLILLLFTALPAIAQIPRTINYQGSLKESDGTPVNGTVNMQFALYETLAGETALWTESHPTVAVTNGIYSVTLGSSVPFGLAFDVAYFLQISVAGAALKPRQALTSVPYAQKSKSVEGITRSGNWFGIGTTSPNGLLQIGDFSQGDAGIFRFKNNWFSLEGSAGTDDYPYISFADENNVLAMSLGAGSKLNKRMDLSLQDNHQLQFRGDGDFLRISDFDDGASIHIGTTSSLPGIMRIRPVWNSTAGFALTSIADSPGVFVRASDGNVGIGTTTPSQKLDVIGNEHISGWLRVVGGNHAVHGVGTQIFSQNALSLDSSGGISDKYPYIEWRRNGARGAFLGWGSHGSYFQFQLGSGNDLAILGGNVGIGTTTPQYALDVSGTIRGTVVTTSDIRRKEEITGLDRALSKIITLRGTKFRMKQQNASNTPKQPAAPNIFKTNAIDRYAALTLASTQTHPAPVQPHDQRLHLGVIAQEVEQVFPEAVFTDDNGYKSVAYHMLIAPLIEAVKELNAQNTAQNVEIEALKAQNAEFERRLNALETRK